MTAYDWPQPGRQQRHDDQRARRAFNAGRGTFAGGTIAEPAADVGVRAAAERGRRPLGARSGRPVVLGSDESGSPQGHRAVTDVWVEPVGGRRAYAAAANGGIWYTDDAGASWRALGGWRSADLKAASLFASPLANGCLLVEFHDDPKDDEVWVGTGEGPLLLQGTPGDVLPGVGVLHAVGPSTKPETDPVFTAEATNLLGAGIYRLSRQRGGTGFAAATTRPACSSARAAAGPEATWVPAAGVPTGRARRDAVHRRHLDPGRRPPSRAPPVGRPLLRPGPREVELWWRPAAASRRVPLRRRRRRPRPRGKLALAASPSGDTLWVLGSAIGTPLRPAVAGRRHRRRAGRGARLRHPRAVGRQGLGVKMVVAVDPADPASVALAAHTRVPARHCCSGP